MLSLDYSAKGYGGLRSVKHIGRSIGLLSGNIVYDPSAPGGDIPLNPVPFTTYNTLTFYDREGRSIGSFGADLIEGRVFHLGIPGAPGTRAIRFRTHGPLKNGTGPFQDIKGMMTDNSVVNFTPHVSATIYVLLIHDPDEGRFRTAITRA